MSELKKAASTAEALAETHSKTADGLQFAPVVRDHYRDAADALRRLAKEVPQIEAENARLREALKDIDAMAANGVATDRMLGAIRWIVRDALEGRE